MVSSEKCFAGRGMTSGLVNPEIHFDLDRNGKGLAVLTSARDRSPCGRLAGAVLIQLE
jgi:hypothetical protein